MVVLEKDLRVFVKNCFEENSKANETLFFVEAGKGGSEGMADVFWPYAKQLIPIELKIFRDGFFLRPSQYSFHRNCLNMKIPSFVVGTIPCDDPDESKMIIIDGSGINLFRCLSKREFYNLDNKDGKGCFWTGCKSDFHVFEGESKKVVELSFRNNFNNVLLSRIEESVEGYE